jgi:hypothetical protein
MPSLALSTERHATLLGGPAVKKYPVVVKTPPALPKIAVGKSKPLSQSRRGQLIETESPPATAEFLRFSYSYTEVSASGPTARIKSRRAAYENGRLVSEQFDGELDRADFDRMAVKAQRYFTDQTSLLLRSLFPFLR